MSFQEKHSRVPEKVLEVSILCFSPVPILVPWLTSCKNASGGSLLCTQYRSLHTSKRALVIQAQTNILLYPIWPGLWDKEQFSLAETIHPMEPCRPPPPKVRSSALTLKGSAPSKPGICITAPSLDGVHNGTTTFYFVFIVPITSTISYNVLLEVRKSLLSELNRWLLICLPVFMVIRINGS